MDTDSEMWHRLQNACEEGLAWAADEDYAGWDPYDGLNSRLLSPFARGWFLRLVAMHFVHKFPINVRPLLAVPKQRNPKGIALFAMTYSNLYEESGDERYLTQAERLLDWLKENTAPGYDHPCWGYNFGWQNARKFYLPAGEPSIVVSIFCARAFVRHYELTGEVESLSVAAATVEFIRSNINSRQINGFRVYTYTQSDEFVVVNANALAAALFARVGAHRDDESVLREADELASFVAATQAESGAWYYAVPRSESHLSHDNFHTGFVVEALRTYLDVRGPDEAIQDAYDSGLAFYRQGLFEDDGAPKFEHDTRFPRDAHAAGQALRTLVLDGQPDSLALADEVGTWSLEHLYDEEGYFYRRRGRFLDDTTPYMRWSQAWMCYGLSTYIRDRSQESPTVDRETSKRGQTGAPLAKRLQRWMRWEQFDRTDRLQDYSISWR